MQLNLNIWEGVRKQFISEFGTHTYKFWIDPLSVTEPQEGVLELQAPNIFFADWIRERYIDKILQYLKALTGKEYKIKLTTREQPLEQKVASPSQVISKHILERLNPNYTFRDFVVGECNKLAHAAALAVSASPAKAYNPLFIYGGVGLGKTHLLHAIGHEIISRYPHFRVQYISSEEFTNQLIQAIQTQRTVKFREKYRNVDLLLIDDIHFLAGKSGIQEEFFHTFNALYDAHKQIVISSDRSPKEIPELEERLVSRFHWGLVVDVQKPDYETRMAILHKKAQRFQLAIPQEVLSYIAEKITSNIRELEGALLRVVAHATLIDEQISITLAQRILHDMIEEHKSRINIAYIMEKTAEFFNLTVSDLKSKSRKKSVVLPRQIAIYLMRKYTDASLSDIGNTLGGRDHTTILHAIQKVEEERTGKLKGVVDKLEEKFFKNV